MVVRCELVLQWIDQHPTAYALLCTLELSSESINELFHSITGMLILLDGGLIVNSLLVLTLNGQ